MAANSASCHRSESRCVLSPLSRFAIPAWPSQPGRDSSKRSPVVVTVVARSQWMSSAGVGGSRSTTGAKIRRTLSAQVVPPKFGPGSPRRESRLGPLTSGPQPRRTTLVRFASCPPTRGRRKSGGPDPSRLAAPSQDLGGQLSARLPYGSASPCRGLVSHPSRGRAEPEASAGTLGDASQRPVQLRRKTVIRRLNAPKFTGCTVAVGPVARTLGRDFGR